MLRMKGDAPSNIPNLLNLGTDANNRSSKDGAIPSSNEITDNKEENALFYAVQQRENESVVRALIGAGADINMPDKEGKTALVYAANVWDNDRVIHALIGAGADVNMPDKEGKTALFYAVQQSNNECVVRALIEAGADVNRTNNEGKTALFFAVQNNNDSVVRALIEQENSLTSPRDIYGRTPLFYAMTKSQSIICYLLEKKVNTRIKDNCGMSFLSFFIDHCISKPAHFHDEPCMEHFTCISERMNLMVQKGVRKNTVHKAILNIIFCKCPLLFNSEINVPIFIFFLELAKTYSSTENESGIDGVLEMVRKTVKDKTLCRTLVPQILDLLCELEADPNSADTEGNTALHYATRLPFCGVSKEAVMDLFKKLEEVGVTVDTKNHQSETPLLFCLTLSSKSNDQRLLDEGNQLSDIKILVEVCRFLIKNIGSNVEETTKKGDSVLHLIMRLLQQILEWHGDTRLKDAVQVGIELFILFSSTRAGRIVINKKNENLNTPIHLWASLEPPHQCLRGVADGRSVFSDFMKKALNKLLDCKTELNERNKHGQTPLHLCKTWTAVELLLDSGANPDVEDSSGRSPLIVAAQNKTLLTARNNLFYPDVELDPKAFWKTAPEKGLDSWTVDEHGNSVLRCLIESEAVDLAKAMIDVYRTDCKHSRSANPKITNTILNTLCEDNKPAHAHWKQEYVKNILASLEKPLSVGTEYETSPLHWCCRNIIEASRDGLLSVQTTIHWAIAQILLAYKADCTIPDEKGQSCLDIAEECSELKELLNKQIDPEASPNYTKWKPERCVANRYIDKLKEVSKSNNCVELDKSGFWYHKDPIGNGSFGCKVFAGISVEDGMEVAIKRICKEKKNCMHEIGNLVRLSSVDRQQLVCYYRQIPSDNYLYVIFELMEGDLFQLNAEVMIKERKRFCQQLLKGVQNMHENDIIHRHLNPYNILILNRSGQRQLKIAGFGMSCEINSPFPAEYEDDMESKYECWSAPEVLNGHPHSKESDMYSCGLVSHYIMLGKRHPYESQSDSTTVTKIKNGSKIKWDTFLCPESVHVLESILAKHKNERSSANELLGYPYLWSDDEKADYLRTVVDKNLRGAREVLNRWDGESSMYENIVGKHKCKCKRKCKCNSWDKPLHNHKKMPEIFEQMNSSAQKLKLDVSYCTTTVWGLLRFIRNAYTHISDLTKFNKEIGTWVSQHVLLEYFPKLVVEVFKELR